MSTRAHADRHLDGLRAWARARVLAREEVSIVPDGAMSVRTYVYEQVPEDLAELGGFWWITNSGDRVSDDFVLRSISEAMAICVPQQAAAAAPEAKRTPWEGTPVAGRLHQQLGNVTDVVLPDRQGDADAVVAALAKLWPNAVVHDLVSEPLPVSSWRLRTRREHKFLPGDEVFVYRDRESFDSWEREGATPENAAALVHIVLGPNSMTVVAARSVFDSDGLWHTCACGARFFRLPAREGEVQLDPSRCAVCQASNPEEALAARRRHVEVERS